MLLGVSIYELQSFASSSLPVELVEVHETVATHHRSPSALRWRKSIRCLCLKDGEPVFQETNFKPTFKRKHFVQLGCRLVLVSPLAETCRGPLKRSRQLILDGGCCRVHDLERSNS